jgi:hypothetical protein
MRPLVQHIGRCCRELEQALQTADMQALLAGSATLRAIMRRFCWMLGLRVVPDILNWRPPMTDIERRSRARQREQERVDRRAEREAARAERRSPSSAETSDAAGTPPARKRRKPWDYKLVSSFDWRAEAADPKNWG